jgi:hypothetical protein
VNKHGQNRTSSLSWRIMSVLLNFKPMISITVTNMYWKLLHVRLYANNPSVPYDLNFSSLHQPFEESASIFQLPKIRKLVK